MEDNVIEKAMAYATQAHDKQYRKGYGLPYIVHPIEVMKRVAVYGVRDSEVIASAVLHDVIEDTYVTHKKLIKEFGQRVADIVSALSRSEKDGSDFVTKYNYLKTFSEKPPEVLVIKVADRFVNVFDYFMDEKKHRYASQYALQAHPVYLAIFNKHESFIEMYGEHTFENIMNDISLLEKIILQNEEYLEYTTNADLELVDELIYG
jgi:(p)ppGpp synthase/HD superfamily hydrolase